MGNSEISGYEDVQCTWARLFVTKELDIWRMLYITKRLMSGLYLDSQFFFIEKRELKF